MKLVLAYLAVTHAGGVVKKTKSRKKSHDTISFAAYTVEVLRTVSFALFFIIHPGDFIIHPGDSIIHPGDFIIHPGESIIHPGDFNHPSWVFYRYQF